jgi:chromosome segregation ATPase
MKKTILLLAIVPMLMACGNGGTKTVSNSNEDSVNRILNQKDAEINNLLGTINDIQEGLSQITEAQGRINTLKSSTESSATEDIRENIAYIQRIMDQNRSRIEQLQQQLHNSNINAENLQKTIESLQQQVAEKDAQIEKMTAELAQKDSKIMEQATEISKLNSENTNLQQDKENLSQANEAKARTISQQDKDLNKAWYVFGTKKELKEHNILKKGDVLTQGFNKNYLTEIDIRTVKRIPLGSKSAHLLTTHPSSSYTLERDANKKYTLHITDPSLFWSVSKYLVVLVK